LIQGRWVRLLRSAKFVPERSNDGGVLRRELPLRAGSSLEVYVNMNLHNGFSITITDCPKTLAQAIEANLAKNHTALEITRHGIGVNTRYSVVAA
jgi:hypothetical protein